MEVHTGKIVLCRGTQFFIYKKINEGLIFNSCSRTDD